MVIIEAMAHGCVVVATPVGDIPLHIRNGENGFIFSSVDDKESICNEGQEILLKLKTNPVLFEEISAASLAYANAKFGMDKFNGAYKEIIKY